MLKKDSASKRSVPSPGIVTLSDRLASGGTSTPQAMPTLPQALNQSGKRKSGGGSGKGLSSKTGYDVATRVSFGGGSKNRK